MRRGYTFVSLVIVFVLGLNPVHGQKIPVAVMDLEAHGISDVEAAALSNRLRNELFKTGEFNVVDRGMMENILNEQDFQLSGCTSSDCLVEIGMLIGAQQMVGGSISKIGNTFTVSAQLVDVETGAVIRVADIDLRGALDDLLTRGISQVAALLSNGVAPTPRLVQSPQSLTPIMSDAIPSWKIQVGYPVVESGYALEIVKMIKAGIPLGQSIAHPAITFGAISRANDVDNMNYFDKRIYISISGHIRSTGSSSWGDMMIGFGVSSGTYEEYSLNYPMSTLWTSEESQSVFSMGYTYPLNIGSITVPVQLKLITTPLYEVSLYLNIGYTLK